MPFLKIWSPRLEWTDDQNQVHTFGDKSTDAPKSLTFTVWQEQQFSVANGTIKQVFDNASTTDMADFDFLWIVANRTLVELQVTAGAGTANEKFMVFTLRQNVAMIFGTDDTRNSANAGVDTFAGDVDTIDEIWVKNASGSAALIKVATFT